MCYKKCLRLRSGNNNQKFFKGYSPRSELFSEFSRFFIEKGPKFCKKQYLIMNSNEIKV